MQSSVILNPNSYLAAVRAVILIDFSVIGYSTLLCCISFRQKLDLLNVSFAQSSPFICIFTRGSLNQ